MKKLSLKCLIPVILTTVFLFSTALASGIEDYSEVPPFVVSSAPPNVLLDLSIETPMQGAAYNDQTYDGNNDGDTSDSCDCAGRAWESSKSVGYCYSPNQEYLGIFDPNKAYSYSSGRFVPQGPTNADHSTSGKWSGNLLNWATMTAIDEFRWVMTGGNRVTDTTSETVLQRANMTLSTGHSWYPVKKINASLNVAPSTVTPYSDTTIYITSHNYQIDVGTSVGGYEKANDLNVQVLACDPSKGLEGNCTDYGGYYKPEGLIQNNDSEMRFAVMAYLYDSSQSRDGGVLRSNMKYVGPFLPDGSSNPVMEYDIDGIFITNPESASEGNSGVINYINKFGSNGYKGYDPAGELFYECLNYYKNRGPTSEYSSGLTTAMKDGFPVITSWDDPIQYWCQRNYIVGINDANPWLDKQLPGTYFTSSTFNGHSLIGNDYGEPSNPDTDYSVTTWTNTVGDLEGLTNTSQSVGCTASSCDMSNTNKNIPGLGEVMGTSPYPGKENSYYIAGMAYYANTQDIRSGIAGTQTVQTFMVDTQEYSSNPLTGQMNMLWLAGKYGGFTETDANGAVHNDTNSDGIDLEPDLTEEWDADSDGVPDNYVLATDPEKLVTGLKKVFSAIAGGANSGTAASVISNTRSGQGAVYQSIFYPSLDDEACNNSVTRDVSWVGEVHALFVDGNGNMREDTNDNRKLEAAVDKFIIFNGTDVFKYTDLDADDILDTTEKVLSNEEQTTIQNINYLWTSSSWLNADALNPTTQRSSYATVANNRYIFTFVDDGDMVKQTGEQMSFSTSNLATISPYLHVFDPFEYSASSPPPGITSGDFTAFVGYQAARLVDYIRGEDQGTLSFSSSIIPAMRSRQIDWDCDGSAETWRLGNIVYSTPTMVGVPSEDYDLLYKDTSYKDFYATYKNRRNVVYVGANDGMLHAFNAGFYDKTNNEFDLESATGGEAMFPLGAELWAYVPFNLLPHLYWLSKPTFKDNPVYYVDLKPRIFDAKIFTDDSTHPHGWGTVMVCGMRFGGGVISTDKDHDGTLAAGDQLMHSAYIIMDITDPEQPPEVLAEVTFSDLGFTTSYPAVIYMDPKTTNKWYLVLGSGPIDSVGAFTTAMEDGTSNQNAKIYIIDLNAVGAGTTPLKDALGSNLPAAGAFQTLPDTNSFISDIIAVDFDLDYLTNAVYFGTISGSTGSWGGKLRRIVLEDDIDPNNWIGDSTLADVLKPISAAPTVAKDTDGRFWVYFGTGRFLNRTDVLYTNTQTFYGVKEPWTDANTNGYPEISELDWTQVDIVNDLVDVSNASVFESDLSVTGVTGVNYFDELLTKVDNNDGWYLDFPYSGERNLGQGTLLGDLVTFTTYTPTTDVCDYRGDSLLYLLYYKTGTAYYKSVVGTNSDEVIKTLDLGEGMTTTPNIFSEPGSNETKAFVQSSTGAIITIDQANPGITTSGRISWQEEQ